ncbi:hypothetical protein CFI11_06500 [Thalassococcus sp. S3]|nr:hypothetical protein CFI11_06500 [Thalassococcus sp. S3]
MMQTDMPGAVPHDFVFDSEHPILPIPFTAHIGDEKLDGSGLSIAAAYVSAPGDLDPSFEGTRHIVKLQFDFEGFSITLFPEMRVARGTKDGEVALQFMDPTGGHLPQLRYIINSFIAGDFVTMGSMLAYSGPTEPKKDKVAEKEDRNRRLIRSVAVAVISGVLILLALNLMRVRLTESYEARPVFIVRSGSEMRATSPGQVAFLNPQASQGEVVYSIAANSGDMLNFKLPCDCEVTVSDGIFEGATVLPIDSILTFFGSSVDVKVQTQMSIEGLSKAMNGDHVTLEMRDGRSIPVTVSVTSATNTAAQRGDLFLPVTLVAEPGTLSIEDIGKPARVRLSKPLFGGKADVVTEQS